MCLGLGFSEGGESSQEVMGDREGDRINVARSARRGETGVHGRIRSRKGIYLIHLICSDRYKIFK